MSVTKKTAKPQPVKRPNWSEISTRVEAGRQLQVTSPDEYGAWLNQVRLMSNGEDLGQVEPWWPATLREMHYEGWADGDFETILSLLGEGTRLNNKLKTVPRFEEEE